jgi:putative ABC transport system ATP-binding protein
VDTTEHQEAARGLAADAFASDAPSDPVIVEDLRQTRPDAGRSRAVLAGVSLRVPAGELVVVAGPPQSGKTTLLSLIGGWHAPEQGSLRVLGIELAGAPPRVRRQVRRQIGFVTREIADTEPRVARERLMTALTLAFAAAPPLLLVDEPTRHLHEPDRSRIAALLRQFARESGAAVLVASEDPAVLAVADRVLRLDDGSLVGLAEPERTTIVYRHSA